MDTMIILMMMLRTLRLAGNFIELLANSGERASERMRRGEPTWPFCIGATTLRGNRIGLGQSKRRRQPNNQAGRTIRPTRPADRSIMPPVQVFRSGRAGPARSGTKWNTPTPLRAAGEGAWARGMARAERDNGQLCANGEAGRGKEEKKKNEEQLSSSGQQIVALVLLTMISNLVN